MVPMGRVRFFEIKHRKLNLNFRVRMFRSRIVVLVLLLLYGVRGQSNSTQSGCDVCASTGDCSKAYSGEPGRFCGNWLDQKRSRHPCCCPNDAICKVAKYDCNCGYVEEDGYGLVWLWYLLGSLALLLCCCSCSFVAFKRASDHGADSFIPVATPVDGEYYGRRSARGGGMSAATGAALGGTAGFVGGYMIGNSLATSGDSRVDGGGCTGGYGGNNGGGDFAGDF
ncbi:hypothetical protein CCR75_008375 [Bremia lactucae]|uniref:Uncharacterized protein n=1 Tax=Bremia lactucae TaxID=4779 RepID=A0A976FGR1_BRELC|nr:hypothetical protein CCR75_008375 [Bremia lactucae]